MSLTQLLAVGKRPAPWPTSKVLPRFSLLIWIALVAPPMLAKVAVDFTKAGATYALTLSSRSSALPSSLMVPPMSSQYAKSTLVSSVMPKQGIACSFADKPKANLMRMRSLDRASCPPTSNAGSASANPRACASPRISSYEHPVAAIFVSMKLVQPFMMPSTFDTESPTKSFWREWMMGMPPSTAASNPNCTSCFLSRPSISGMWAAINALFAVTTSCPALIASNTKSLAAVTPPATSTTRSMSLFPMIL
mmetsp:Transcript_2350/g.3930  ORF Transcript_2350/g.3930 Transcript_2350/m.3930 type:complete len:250 (-) Transcript_2350:225-974(-)